MGYSPTLGRWLEADPDQYCDGSNLYQFVRSSPIRNVDPKGLLAIADAIYVAKIAGLMQVQGGQGLFAPGWAQLYQEREQINKELGPEAVKEGVITALRNLGVTPFGVQKLDFNFAYIGPGEYPVIKCWLNDQMTETYSTHSRAESISLGGGYELKFYEQDDFSAQVAVVHETASFQHKLDWFQFTIGNAVNGDIAEDYGDFAIVSKDSFISTKRNHSEHSAHSSGAVSA